VLQVLVTAKIVPSSLILFTLTIEDIRFSETSILAKVTQRVILDDNGL
jgi:hypothetical protein